VFCIAVNVSLNSKYQKRVSRGTFLKGRECSRDVKTIKESTQPVLEKQD
jgi:hypothetical protein